MNNFVSRIANETSTCIAFEGIRRRLYIPKTNSIFSYVHEMASLHFCHNIRYSLRSVTGFYTPPKFFFLNSNSKQIFLDILSCMQRVAFLCTHIFSIRKIYMSCATHDDRDFLVVLQIMFTKPLSFTQNVVVYLCCYSSLCRWNE